MASQRRRSIDHRIIIFLLIGSMICLTQLPRSSSHPNPVRQAPAVFWLSLVKGEGNFYQIAPGNGWSDVYTILGLAPPSEDWIAKTWPPPKFSAYSLNSHQPPKLIPLPSYASPLAFQPIPVNSVSSEMLTIIPGIGPNLATEIVYYRQKDGPIKGIADLWKIRGIGLHKSKTICRFVSF